MNANRFRGPSRKPQATVQLVLVFDRALLDQLGAFQGYSLDVEHYLAPILDLRRNHFIPRNVAERDFRYKQLIPYVLLRFEDRLFSYVRGRQSGEHRLLYLHSIGLGGHIEPRDDSLYSSSTRDIYLAAAQREVMEEVYLRAIHRERLVALINDDSNDVGRVHFAIVHIWDVDKPAVTSRESSITRAAFVPISDLMKAPDRLETWSRIALQALCDPRIPGYSLK